MVGPRAYAGRVKLPLLMFAAVVLLVTVMTGFGARYVFGLQDATHFDAVALGLAVIGLLVISLLAWRRMRGTRDRPRHHTGLPPGVQ
jgi:membrane protein implicated in regulation of membrane protease activity